MKSKFLTPILIIILLAILAFVFLLPKAASSPLKSPLGNILQNNATPQPAASNYAPPKEVKLDASSDLGVEIDKVNPQVLNADFEVFNSL